MKFLRVTPVLVMLATAACGTSTVVEPDLGASRRTHVSVPVGPGFNQTVPPDTATAPSDTTTYTITSPFVTIGG